MIPTGNCLTERRTANAATSKVGKGHKGWKLLGGNLNLAMAPSQRELESLKILKSPSIAL